MIVLANTRRSGFLWEQIENGKLVNHNPEVIDDLTLFLPSSRWQYKRWLNDRVGCAPCKGGVFSSGCESHPAMLLQPEAIGAVMEVTKWLKPLM